MNLAPTIAVIGRDARQVFAADYLSQHNIPVTTYGLCDPPKFAKPCKTYQDAVKNAQILLLPLPLSRDQLQITGTDVPFSMFFACLKEETTIFCGLPDNIISNQIQKHNCTVIDYAKDEIFMIRNALPTAEGAVGIAMSALRRTISGSQTLVVGYGRIGKLLADLLHSMGATVTVAARKETDLALARLHGCQTCLIHEDGDYSTLSLSHPYHVILNTVPVRLIDEKLLRTLKPDTVLIDLASAPGGIDYDAANRIGLKTIIALSLPGQVTPITAGEIIGDLIISHIEKRREIP